VGVWLLAGQVIVGAQIKNKVSAQTHMFCCHSLSCAYQGMMC